MTPEVYERRTLPVIYEHWLPVVGWEGLYEVSCRGRLRSLDRRVITSNGRRQFHRGRIRALHLDSWGYLKVRLQAQGRDETRLIHVLVLRAFAGPRPPGYDGCHGPGGLQDNRWPENICWGTKSKNQGADRMRDGTLIIGTAHKRAKLTDAIVAECRQRRADGETFNSLSAAFGVGHATMWCAVTGATWRHVPMPG